MKKLHSEYLDSSFPGIFKAIFTTAPNLSRLLIHGIMIEGGVADLEYLVASIRSRKLKSFALLNSPITYVNLSKMIFDSFSFSAIENLEFSATEDILFSGWNIIDLIKVLPSMDSLKTLSLAGEEKLQNTLLFTEFVNTLQHLNIKSLSLLSAKLDDNSALLLAKWIPKSKLKQLDLRFNRLSLKGVEALEAVTNYIPGFKLEVRLQELQVRKRKHIDAELM